MFSHTSKSCLSRLFPVGPRAESIHGDYGHFRAIVSSDGTVHWEPGGVFKTGCEIDITYYPFDEQRCRLVFGAWSYHTVKMNITNMSSSVNLDSYEGNGEWTIHHTQVTSSYTSSFLNGRRRFYFQIDMCVCRRACKIIPTVINFQYLNKRV